MSDDDSAVSAVHVGGDAYGGVRLNQRRTRRARAGARAVTITGALSAMVLAGSGVLWFLSTYATSQIKSVKAGTAGSDPRGAMNILLVGVDKRDDLTRQEQNRLHLGREVGQRSDTMMVIHLSEDHSKVTVVSLPRDSWVDIPGKGSHKINSAYSAGGAPLAVRTVQNATGLTINHYVEVNVLGFIRVVDALGGVSVCTPVAIDDQHTGFKLQPGTYELDGAKALFYARTRATARSDLDRIDRQQQVISALLHRALSGGTLANPGKLTGLVGSALKTLTVDEELSKDLLGLANQLKDVSTDDVAFTTVPLADVNYRAPTGESAVLWDKVAARDLFRRIGDDEPLVKPVKSQRPSSSPSSSPTAGDSAGDPGGDSGGDSGDEELTVPPDRIAVKVINGTSIAGLGARTKAELVKAGFQVPAAPGDTATRNYTDPVVRYPAGREDSARTLAAAVPGAQMREADVTGIELIVGTKYTGAEKVTIKTTTTTATAAPPATAAPAARTATENICKK
ncbi:LytR family transcriptional regulator [Sphaerisporangium siamense]|uniref:LCP family protein required for cell wall assembly n=1 Tax=Sphaerisporangium siamense TaxID=795645 RepID=A0A7W7DG72_9ACTN|nr:LCP family protein [Sphaerisporangium siamense]MBB4705904.1 LCP family protein required for cell wall assembly [Sphaerisporangium siamense]GII82701.1 LytR family transcriptional regulator [Sphaerisporangium siamense]